MDLCLITFFRISRLKKCIFDIRKKKFHLFLFLNHIFRSLVYICVIRNVAVIKNDRRRKKMKKLCEMLWLPLVLASCNMLGVQETEVGKGEIRISFASGQDLTRSVPDVPDTSDFLLYVTDEEGTVIYEGVYGASPEAIEVDPGSYTIRTVSCEFEKPAFASPQFGDEQCVVVPSGEIVNVRLTCRQMNAGIRLDVDPGFLTAYPGGSLFLKSAQGKLMYGYSEKRAAYFKPGNVSLVLSNNGTDQTLLTKTLQAQDMLVLGISVAQPSPGESSVSGSAISVAVDTTRNWMSDHYVIGGDQGKGSEAEDALTVSQAKASVDMEDVWVSGYIVGGDLSSSSASFDSPFSSRTNILLGPRSSTTDKDACVSVQLPSGDVRDALNLVDNPGLLGVKVCVRGDVVEAYYGIVGIKNVTEYEFY